MRRSRKALPVAVVVAESPATAVLPAMATAPLQAVTDHLETALAVQVETLAIAVAQVEATAETVAQAEVAVVAPGAVKTREAAAKAELLLPEKLNTSHSV